MSSIFQSNHDSTFTFKNNHQKETDYSIKELYDSVYEENASFVDCQPRMKNSKKINKKFPAGHDVSQNKISSKTNKNSNKPSKEIEVKNTELNHKNVAYLKEVRNLRNNLEINKSERKNTISRSKSKENINKNANFSPRMKNAENLKTNQNNNDMKSLYKSQNNFISKSQRDFNPAVKYIQNKPKFSLKRNDSSNFKIEKSCELKQSLSKNRQNINKKNVSPNREYINFQVQSKNNKSSMASKSINENNEKLDILANNNPKSIEYIDRMRYIQYDCDLQSNPISTSNVKEEFSFDKTNQTNSLNDFLSGGDSMIENHIFSPNKTPFYRKKRAGRMEVSNNIN